MREIVIPDGDTRNISIGSSLVGTAYEEDTDRLFLRILPGTQLQEIDRRTGQRLRSFAAQQVPAGCGGFTPDEFPNSGMRFGHALFRPASVPRPSGRPA